MGYRRTGGSPVNSKKNNQANTRWPIQSNSQALANFI